MTKLRSLTLSQQLSVIGVAFLIGGTSIGGGMLALPMATSVIGFLPSAVAMIVAWLFMTLTGLMLLEVNLWMQSECHLVTMAGTILGRPGKVIAWLAYVFVCYASLVAYTDGGGRLTQIGFDGFLGINLSKECAYALFVTIFGSLLFLSNQLISRINAVLFAALVCAYLLMIGVGSNGVDGDLLFRQSWEHMGLIAAFPLMLTSFSYQWIIPSLSPMLKNEANMIRLAIIFGTSVSLVIYLLWQWLVLGSVPLDGEVGLAQGLLDDKLSTEILSTHLQSSWLSNLANFFAFFALITSFIGMAISFVDFMADGLDVHRKGKIGFLLVLGTFIPTYYFAIYFINVFLLALDMTGGYGDAIMNGILPVLMIIVGMKKGYIPQLKLLTRWWLLASILLLSVVTIWIETFKLIF